MKKYLVLFGLILLQSCNSSGSGDSVNNTNPSLADIVGVWDDSVTIDNTTDERYTVIRADGTIGGYDYLGDSFYNGLNCYDKVADITIIDLGGGDFFINFTIFHVIISDGELVVTNPDSGVTFTSVPSLMLESDFAPICGV